MSRNLTIQVFEHEFLPIGEKLQQHHFVALSKLNTLHKDRYFDLRYNGIKFRNFVGVIQVDGLTIEILPKIDSNESDYLKWQSILIDMLKVTRKLNVQKVGDADVSKQSIHLLDIYFEWFLNEVRLLQRQGLIKQYHNERSNVKALKGKLEFSQHINKNIVHKERFFTTHQIYDYNHLIHQILNQALGIIANITKGGYLYGKCKSVQLDFPEVKAIFATEATFSSLKRSRKTSPYHTALTIARLIILNYAPHVKSGSENMIALLFDMNALWEEYVMICLKKAAYDKTDLKVFAQNSQQFWNGISIRPDIVIQQKVGIVVSNFIIDTKWKNITNNPPSIQDLRQMYVYNDYWKSKKAILLYPSHNTSFSEKEFINFESIPLKEDHACGLGKVSICYPGTATLNPNIGVEILKWFGIENQYPIFRPT